MKSHQDRAQPSREPNMKTPSEPSSSNREPEVDKPVLEWPPDLDDWEIEAKGWFPATVRYRGATLGVVFYDPVRLSQEIADGIESGKLFHEPNLVVLAMLGRERIESALSILAESGQLARMCA